MASLIALFPTGRLESSGEVEVLATVEEGTQLMTAVGCLQPDAVVVDIRMPPTHQLEGIEAAHEIRADHPDVGGPGSGPPVPDSRLHRECSTPSIRPQTRSGQRSPKASAASASADEIG